MKTRIIAAALGAALSACASLPPAALSKLAKLDVLTTDPSNLSVAAVMPAPLRLRTGDVLLRFAMRAPAPYGSADETMALAITANEPTPGIPRSAFAHTQTAHVAAADIQRLRAAQAKAEAFRASGTDGGKGSLSVSIVGGCRLSELKDTPLIAAIYMRSAPTETYFPLIASLDLRKSVGADAINHLPICDR